MHINLHHGNCLDLLRQQPDNSIDAVVSDPPYGLSEHKPRDIDMAITAWSNGKPYLHRRKGFMGLSWDSFVPGPEIWRECLRVLKPGGYAAIFASPRTQDLTTTALHIGGFSVCGGRCGDDGRPELPARLVWAYGCGLPKSQDLGKVLHSHSAAAGAKWAGWGTNIKPAHEPVIIARKPVHSGDEVIAVHRPASGLLEPLLHYSGKGNSTERWSYCSICGAVGPRNSMAANHKHDLANPGHLITHVSVKPTSVMRWLVRLVAPEGGVVLDPFAGSGSTGVAAILDGRRFVGAEIDSAYHAIAAARLQDTLKMGVPRDRVGMEEAA